MNYSKFVKDVLIYNNIPKEDWASHLSRSTALPELPDFPQTKELASLLKKSKILIYSDKDSDGITGCVVLYKYLKNAGIDVTPFCPKREYGHGINLDVVKKFQQEKGIDLVITVDCGISNANEIAELKKMGIKTVITDHHGLSGAIPDAEFILHPQVNENLSEMVHFSGSGMAWFICYCLEQEWQTWFDLDAWQAVSTIGTIGDVTPLLGLNRQFAKAGLAKMGDTALPGLRALLGICGLHGQSVTEEDLAFQVVPRINAGGRIGDPMLSFAILATDDFDSAWRAAQKLDEMNRIRKEICKDALADVLPKVNPSESVAVIRTEAIHGIVGITAANIVDNFDVPAFIVSDCGNELKGSARAPEWYSVLDGLSAAQQALKKWGGHPAAGGFSLEHDKFDDFKRLLTENCKVQQEAKHLKVKPKLAWDSEYEETIVQDLAILRPLGNAFIVPQFSERVKLQDTKPCRNGVHLFCKVNGIKATGWNLYEKAKALPRGKECDIVYSIGTDTYGAENPYPRITIKKIN